MSRSNNSRRGSTNRGGGGITPAVTGLAHGKAADELRGYGINMEAR